MDRISAKWGFGDAPLKPHHREQTEEAIHVVLRILQSLPKPVVETHLAALSQVKGQFTRTIRQDQWDWATVWRLLGRPSRSPAGRISIGLGQLRTALKNEDFETAQVLAVQLQDVGIARYLDCYLTGGLDEMRQDGLAGFIYIMSQRSQPRLLKIGMTKRSVEVRVREINSASGVVVPLGVRAVWKVDNAAEVERELHELLASYRVRTDREFFDMDFAEASRRINDYLGSRRARRRRERTGDE